ncbi:MAG: lipoyl(octanoyl) transferase LipB [Gammaproteobacteria bacterium]|nr:lipoyl(octanoyl) transferase LipB [Gammaproteobacteria bacterium]
MAANQIQIRDLGLQDYLSVWQQMRDYTESRTENTADQIWLVEHPPVFTQGRAGKPEHVLAPGEIPLVQTDRGGQVTYHGPGQLILYPLLDLKRLKLGIRPLVEALENAVVELLKGMNITAYGSKEAPGVYVDGKKIASIGLRIRKQCSYHGLSLNVRMDPEPFSRINPCGYKGLEVTQISTLCSDYQVDMIKRELVQNLAKGLGFDALIWELKPEWDRNKATIYS